MWSFPDFSLSIEIKSWLIAPPRPPEPKVAQPAPLKNLKGKVAYITASSDGIGLGIARAAANAGMKVCIGYRNEERLKAA